MNSYNLFFFFPMTSYLENKKTITVPVCDVVVVCSRQTKKITPHQIK